MDWSKIKTIFIIAFLLLDVYLIYEYVKIKEYQRADDLPTEPPTHTLSRLGIDYDKEKLPVNNVKDQYLSAKSKKFTDDEIKKLEKGLLSGQEITVRDSIYLQAVLEKPISIDKEFDPDELSDFLLNSVLNGAEYRFLEKKGNTIKYYQQHAGKTLYRNPKAELTFNVNEENKIVSYNQTYLENIKEMDKEEVIMQPPDAILNLFKNNFIESGSYVSHIELGYYTQLDTSAQLLAPTWKVTVNEEDFYVNALDGQVIQPETEEMKVE
ncbi:MULTISPECIES: two-component system regulatory protein YycI [unclassified Niallia]|uniref:two-component system regulatory protein YycI n=1 Tax=unclassified Niallia TaxID=2837522 RepID=UPI0030FC4F0E